MTYAKCSICGVYHFERDRCADSYTVFHPDYLGEEGKVMGAYSFEDCAKHYAEYYDRDEHTLVSSGDSILVKIVNAEGESKIFELSAEPSINYNYRERSAEDFKD
jgi:hypothetical protein